jgi:hypothetical protein
VINVQLALEKILVEFIISDLVNDFYMIEKIILFKLNPNSENSNMRISALKIFLNGTLLALIISVPAIISTVLFHYVIKTNLIITISAGIITLFVAMGFGYKISKRLSM